MWGIPAKAQYLFVHLSLRMESPPPLLVSCAFYGYEPPDELMRSGAWVLDFDMARCQNTSSESNTSWNKAHSGVVRSASHHSNNGIHQKEGKVKKCNNSSMCYEWNFVKLKWRKSVQMKVAKLEFIVLPFHLLLSMCMSDLSMITHHWILDGISPMPNTLEY